MKCKSAYTELKDDILKYPLSSIVKMIIRINMYEQNQNNNDDNNNDNNNNYNNTNTNTTNNNENDNYNNNIYLKKVAQIDIHIYI